MKFSKITISLFIYLLTCITHTNLGLANENKTESESQGQATGDKSRDLLAIIREGNFPYIGGMEATELMLDKLTSLNPLLTKGRALEIGGGHGGNANYLQANGFAQIQVIDIDEEAIKYAKSKYPNIIFKTLNATKLTSNFEHDSFDMVYMLGSAHAIGDKLILLQKIKAVSKPGALLTIMDYNLKSAKESDKLTTSDGQEIYPINLDKLTPQMKYIGWELIQTVDISELYKNWYSSALGLINLSRENLFKQNYLSAEIKFIEDKFNSVLNLINEGKIGGIILIARKI